MTGPISPMRSLAIEVLTPNKAAPSRAEAIPEFTCQSVRAGGEPGNSSVRAVRPVPGESFALSTIYARIPRG